jgi:hypothetical protein
MPAPYNHPQVSGGGWQPPPQQQQQHHQQQVPPHMPVDILGLADKAASALASQNTLLHHPNPNHPPPSGFGYSAPQMQQHMVGQQQSQYPQYGGMSDVPPLLTPQAIQQHQGQSFPPSMPQPPFQQNMSGEPFKRRTQARLDELPVSVQYAVQNLQSSGLVDGPLDPGMLGMIFDLPEPHAIEAIQRFASLDRGTMRNKTAYLAGLLRRELETIKRR